jgi:hypothetical protein
VPFIIIPPTLSIPLMNEDFYQNFLSKNISQKFSKFDLQLTFLVWRKNNFFIKLSEVFRGQELNNSFIKTV